MRELQYEALRSREIASLAVRLHRDCSYGDMMVMTRQRALRLCAYFQNQEMLGQAGCQSLNKPPCTIVTVKFETRNLTEFDRRKGRICIFQDPDSV